MPNAFAGFSTFGNLGSFQAALGGATTFTQDFEGLANGTNLSGVELVPGVTGASSGTSLELSAIG
jgi:hypothetical protein